MTTPAVIMTTSVTRQWREYSVFCVLLVRDVYCYLHRGWNMIRIIRWNYAHAVFPQPLILPVVLLMIYNAGLGWFIKNYFQIQCLYLARLFYLLLYMLIKQFGTVICNLGPDYDAYGELNGGRVCVGHLVNKWAWEASYVQRSLMADTG